jgi:hypothetical protein
MTYKFANHHRLSFFPLHMFCLHCISNKITLVWLSHVLCGFPSLCVQRLRNNGMEPMVKNPLFSAPISITRLHKDPQILEALYSWNNLWKLVPYFNFYLLKLSSRLNIFTAFTIFWGHCTGVWTQGQMLSGQVHSIT